MHAHALDATAFNSLACNPEKSYATAVEHPNIAEPTGPPQPGPPQPGPPQPGNGAEHDHMAERQSAAEHGLGAGDPGAEIVSAWRALAAHHAAVSSALEHELSERHGLGVNEFEVLERLAEGSDHKFRVQELAEAVHITQSTLSRLIGRLEQNGLVQRSMCDMDRRGIYVCLTDAGRKRHAQARPTQRAVLSATLPARPAARAAAHDG